ncbi:MAG TPA: hypothetical protein VEV41_11490 [Terriglobales bacterium]|nr:hypothetical protein [Terriglobales bacterium]
MVTRSRFSTATVVDSKYLVPWLAAEGHLAYSPAEPPARDYFFQYTWILTGVFDSKINLREHRYFGSPLKESARFLFDFWASVRSGHGAALQRYCQPGVISEDEVRTPMAAYRHDRQLYNTPGSVLIQHGSYQWISRDAQPNIEEGDVLLYRGIGQATLFRCLRFRPRDLSPANRAIWRQYVGVQADMLSDSVLSFNTIHDRVRRCETGGLRDGTWLGDELAAKAGLDIRSPGFASNLWHAAQQSYSLDPVVRVRKFGPHHVVVKTCLNNIRITTFFAGESEIKIVDPSRISEVQGFGCEVEFIPPTESDL